MKTTLLRGGVALLASLAPAPGCRAQTFEGVSRSLAGIYAVESYTHNRQGCDREGPSALDQWRDRYVILHGANVMGQPVLNVLSCRDLAQCQEKKATLDQGGFASGEFGYTFTTVAAGDRLTAAYSSGGFASADKKTCTGGSAADRTLARAGGKLRLEERIRPARDYAADDEGLCRTDRALAAADGQACREIIVLTAAAP